MKRIYKLIIIVIVILATYKTIKYNIELNQYLQDNGLQRTIQNAQEFDKIKGYKTTYLD